MSRSKKKEYPVLVVHEGNIVFPQNFSGVLPVVVHLRAKRYEEAKRRGFKPIKGYVVTPTSPSTCQWDCGCTDLPFQQEFGQLACEVARWFPGEIIVVEVEY